MLNPPEECVKLERASPKNDWLTILGFDLKYASDPKLRWTTIQKAEEILTVTRRITYFNKDFLVTNLLRTYH